LSSRLSRRAVGPKWRDLRFLCLAQRTLKIRPAQT
jgi:hypothetical protein